MVKLEDMHGPPILWPRIHSSVHEILSALAHGSHGFVPLDSNPNSSSCEKGSPFLYKPEPPLTHNQCETKGAHPIITIAPQSRRSLCMGERCPFITIAP